ncbi:MAG TPA: type I restriction enzyme HsdR N-terminal domain-containing protein [Thermodesulfobacteriota bacterium]|nr:type I restriction enzyme HsdR N-terminal domain-containing protein [Thermodesulfobacteriota bacterium]
MSESCPGDKYKSGLVAPSECETIKEEVIRDKIVQLLLSEKGFQDGDLELDVPYTLEMGSEIFQLKASILVQMGGRKVVLIKCGAGSIMARERAALALARLFTDYQIPLTIVTNSEDATLLNTLNGETLECGLGAILKKGQLLDRLEGLTYMPLPEKRLKMEKQILSAFEALGMHGECH